VPCAPGVRWGAVWIFETLGWNQTAKLTPPSTELASRSEFGSALAWQRRSDGGGDWLLTGAPGFVLSANGPPIGAVYAIGPFYEGAQWSQYPWQPQSVATARWPPRVTGNALGLGNGDGRFGAALAVDSSSGLAVVAATTRFSLRGPGTGGASLTRYWAAEGCEGPPPAIDPAGCLLAPLPLFDVPSRLLWGDDSVTGDGFGMSVALSSSGVVVVGSPQHSHRGVVGTPDATAPAVAGSGAAYLHFPPPPPPPFVPLGPPPSPALPPSPMPPPPLPPIEMADASAVVVSGITAGVIAVLLLLLFLGSIVASSVQSSRVRARGVQVLPPAPHGAGTPMSCTTLVTTHSSATGSPKRVGD